ncbi:hypothetical protein AAFF_G00014340 [Aldrovandia affinis]|uniref:Uncharacterized protein n=1 Tax=Aldrovandia affinis TaxID=143900 RepID=A0AAD7S6D3_9TELE|nr:hypothetical protein AAFF_G00014340 [Aldrovandia affinis]
MTRGHSEGRVRWMRAILAGIAPASLRRDAATLALARKAQKYDWHILHKATTTPAPPCRLKSRHPYNKAAQEMLQSIPEDLSRDAWLAASWKQTWETAGPSRILRYIRDPGDGLCQVTRSRQSANCNALHYRQQEDTGVLWLQRPCLQQFTVQ